MPGARDLTLPLDQRRRRAVEMRLAGCTLAQIRDETGLSAPTVIAAHKAFVAGGWPAIATRGPGRAKDLGRVLSPPQEAMMRRRLAQANPAGPYLWTAPLVQQDLQELLGQRPASRTVQRYLERWGLSWPGLEESARRDPVATAWLQQVLPGIQQRSQAHAEQLVWCAATRGPAGSWLLVAQNLRGQVAWLPAPALGDLRTHAAFLERLQRTWPGRLRVLMHGLAPQSPGLSSIQTACASIAMEPCPVALPARAPAGAVLRSDKLPAAVPAPGASSPDATPARCAAAPSKPDPVPNRTATMTTTTKLTHLQRLEAESIHIMREVVAECERPVMLYSIGKDSACMLHLAKKAFHPAPPPFPLLHVDTTWKFRDMYALRERMAGDMGMELLVWQNPEAKRLGINPFQHGSQIHTDMWKTQGLKQALDHYGFDAAFGGARRDEEKSRAKERVFSFRSAQHRWDPKQQRPELWHLYNARKNPGESIRVFPLSNWTELDIWQYIHLEDIPIVPLYLARERPVVERDGTLIMVDDDRMPLKPGEVPVMRKVRFRTLGCYPLSGAIESEADTLTAIIQEMLLATTSERQGRLIDHDQAASMEKKKQEGYF